MHWTPSVLNILPPLARLVCVRGLGASPQTTGERWNPFGERLTTAEGHQHDALKPLPVSFVGVHDNGGSAVKVSVTVGLPAPSIIARRGTDGSKPLFKIS